MKIVSAEQAQIDRACAKLDAELERADLVRFEYDDDLAADRIKSQAWDVWIESIPRLARLRHEGSHEEGGIYYGRTCPRCDGSGVVGTRPERSARPGLLPGVWPVRCPELGEVDTSGVDGGLVRHTAEGKPSLDGGTARTAEVPKRVQIPPSITPNAHS